MKKNRKNHGAGTPALGSVGLAVLAMLMGSGAQAADVSFGTPSTVTVTGHKTVQSVQGNTVGVSADTSDTTTGVTVVGPQAGTSNTTTNNQVKPTAIGNTFTNSIDLSLTGNAPDSSAEGSASLGVQTNSGVVSSTANNNVVKVDLTGFTSGSASNTANTIAASTTLNSGSSTIAGTVPNDYTSGTAGITSISYTPGGNSATAQGSIAITSAQMGTGAASSATAGENEVTLSLTSPATATVTAGPVLDNNTVSATLKGNAATSTASIQPSGAPTFVGSAVVSNLQLNQAAGVGVTHSAVTEGTTIGATVAGNAPGVTNTLTGGLSVQGNTVSSAVTGNESLGAAGVAGNRIVLGDGMSVTGSGGPGFNNASFNGGALSNVVAADLAILNSQGNVGVSLSSQTQGTFIGAAVQSIDNGSVNLSGNSVTSAATGNAASSAIASGNNAAAFAATAALASQQSNYRASVEASTGPSAVGVISGSENGTNNASTLTVGNNRIAATAYGSSVSQNLSLEANAMPLVGTAFLNGGSTPDGNVNANGAATVSNLQGNYGAAVSATNALSVLGLSADSRGTGGDTIKASAFAVNGNTQEAVAVGNSAGNALSLTGTSVGSGAGVANVQVVDGNSPVQAELVGATATAYLGTHSTDTSVALTNNLQRAVGYANSASNTLNVAANGANVAAAGGPASVVFAAGNNVSAGYGVLSSQSALGDVTASASGTAQLLPVSALQVLVEGNVTRGTVTNEGNAFVGAAYGNDVANGAKLALGTGVTTTGFSSVANVTSVQNAAGAVEAAASGGSVVNTSIEDNLANSSVSTSTNQIQALAYGNRASGNTLSVTGNSLSTASTAGVRQGAVSNVGQLITDASFSVQNVQTGSGSVTATQRDTTTNPASPLAAQVRTDIGGSVTGSTVASNGNSSSAAATSNSATNGLTLAGTTIATSGALQNSQGTSADVNALIGLAGTPGSPATPSTPFTYNAHVLDPEALGGNTLGGNTTITSGTLGVLQSSLTPAEITYLTSNGWAVGTGANAGLLTAPANILGVVSTTTYDNLHASQSVPFNATIPGASATAAVPNQGGVTVAVAGAVTNSQLSVNGNTANGAVTGNTATNSVSVTGGNIAAGSGATVATAGTLPLGSGTGAQADHALSNVQQVNEGASLTTSVFGTYAIDTTAGAAISGSTLSVSNNSQRGSAVANTAANSVALSGNSVQATTALASQQSSAAAVSAGSALELYAPGAVSNSSVALSGNKNVSLGVINDVTNTLAVTGTNVTPVGAAVNATLNPATATGDHVLNNNQVASTSVSSAASTRLYNQDQVATATAGLANSSVTVTGNSTAAEASANRADNSVALNGAALQGANAGLVNTQSSSAAVASNATTSATFQLNGTAPASAAALNSGVTIDGNSTTSLARGNAATNALNVAAGSSYGTSTAGTAGSTLGTTQATAAVLNTQGNSGAVTSNATGTYQVALNGQAVGTVPGLINGTAAVTGNTVAAQAYGNSATNTLTVTAPATGRPTAAIGNYQTNSGAIVATATGVNYGVGVTGATNGSTLRAAGNQVTATAVGNSAVSTIASAR
ncbi:MULTISPECIES: beta strand repeat-containing protein [unclassified Variovorax]|uniref:beta strand repeat-containing protein n=1 Tax=unclassified Variovorax TaxID=663243 RepID=UPI0018FE1669|nr:MULTISPECIES: S-layer family protein [unclassified Variovorax]QRY29640.1 S-layer family protein [Variovorax sp. PDNC026]